MMFKLNNNKEYTIREIGGKFFLVPVKRNVNGLKIFNFTEIGVWIWSNISTFNSIDSLLAQLKLEHNDLNITRQELMDFIQNMKNANLLLEE